MPDIFPAVLHKDRLQPELPGGGYAVGVAADPKTRSLYVDLCRLIQIELPVP